MTRCSLCLLLLLAGWFGCVRSRNITLAVLWNEAGAATVAQNLFQQTFLPKILQTCPSVPGVNETKFEFVEIVQRGMLDLRQALEQLRSLSSCLFAGAYDLSLAPFLEQAAIPSEIPRIPSMRLHSLAPLPPRVATPGILAALKQIMGGNLTAANSICVILGTGFDAGQFAVLIDKFPGGVWLFRLVPGTEFALITELKKTGSLDFLLAAPPQETDDFVNAALKSQMLDPTYRWFLYSTLLMKRNNFDGFIVVSKNITLMDFGPMSSLVSQNLTELREVYLHDLLTVWSVYLKNILCDEPDPVDTTVSGLTGTFSLLPNGTVNRLNWFMHFYQGLGAERGLTGNWSSDGDFNFDPSETRVPSDEQLTLELKKNVFRVVTVIQPPYVQFTKGLENATNLTMYSRLEGFAMGICKSILNRMELTNVEVFLQEDGRFGSYDPATDSWTGMVGTLMQGRAGLACGPFSDTAGRREVIKFSQPYLSFQLSILYATQPENPLLSVFQFLTPMHLTTWMTVLGSVLAAALVQTVLHQISRNAENFSLYETVFLSFASIVRGLTGATPDRPSGQTAMAVFWLFALAILVAYTANYAASCTLDTIRTPITSLESLPVQSELEYGTLAGSVYLELMKNSNNPGQQAAYRHIIENPQTSQPLNTSQALQMVATGDFAFIYSSVMNDYFSELICNTDVAGSFGQDSAMLGLPANAEYGDMVDRIIGELVEGEDRDQLYEEFFSPPDEKIPDCTNLPFPYSLKRFLPSEPLALKPRDGALTLSNTLGIAVINLGGCLLTLLLAAAEVTYRVCAARCRRARETRDRDHALRESSLALGGRRLGQRPSGETLGDGDMAESTV